MELAKLGRNNITIMLCIHYFLVWICYSQCQHTWWKVHEDLHSLLQIQVNRLNVGKVYSTSIPSQSMGVDCNRFDFRIDNQKGNEYHIVVVDRFNKYSMMKPYKKVVSVQYAVKSFFENVSNIYFGNKVLIQFNQSHQL